MPELPEVEVAARQVRAWARGKRIARVEVAPSRVIRPLAPSDFEVLQGHALRDIHRYGKWMLWDLGRGLGLLSHLGMTGKWVRLGRGELPPPHTRASLTLAGGSVLHYRDPRLFGRLLAGPLDELRASSGLAALGPDPLAGIDVPRLHAVLAGTQRSLKEALMDQRVLAGLGNIHVGEALFRARLHPERPGTSLRPDEAERLARAIDEGLRFALAHEDGPEPITYVEEGGDNPFLVYSRGGEPCPECGRPIERIVQGGRSTFFCARCQPLRSVPEPGRRPPRAAVKAPLRPRPARRSSPR